MTKSTPAPKAMQADSMLDDAAPHATTEATTQTPDPSGPAATPDVPGADNPGPTPEEIAAEAKAKADAEAAEADAKAKADAEAAEADAKAKADAEAVAEDPQLDIPALRYCAKLIADLNTSGHRLALMDELRDNYGLDATNWRYMQDPPTDDGPYTISMQGITTEPAPFLEQALDNWANAARRAIAAVEG